jgi:FkbM family methyltransferase
MSISNSLRTSRSALEEYSRRRACGVYYGEHRMLCRLLGDFLAFVDTRDLMLGPRLVLDGFWEAWVTLALARYLQPGAYCVDVGANYGYYTLLFAAACGPEGRVIACEPNPLLAERYLPQNLALNGFYHGVDVCPKVICDQDAPAVDFVLHEGDFATASLEQWSYAHRCETVQAPAITLDTLCRDLPRLDLVKIDAEGAEALVWRGMQTLRARFPQAAVVMELHLQRDPHQIASFLHELQHQCELRYINYAGEIAPANVEVILASPQEHWTLWLQG